MTSKEILGGIAVVAVAAGVLLWVAPRSEDTSMSKAVGYLRAKAQMVMLQVEHTPDAASMAEITAAITAIEPSFFEPPATEGTPIGPILIHPDIDVWRGTTPGPLLASRIRNHWFVVNQDLTSSAVDQSPF